MVSGAQPGAIDRTTMAKPCANDRGVPDVPVSVANELSTLLGPFFLPTQINLPMLRNAISQIQVDKALVRDSRFIGHFFEVIDDILT